MSIHPSLEAIHRLSSRCTIIPWECIRLNKWISVFFLVENLYPSEIKGHWAKFSDITCPWDYDTSLLSQSPCLPQSLCDPSPIEQRGFFTKHHLLFKPFQWLLRELEQSPSHGFQGLQNQPRPHSHLWMSLSVPFLTVAMLTDLLSVPEPTACALAVGLSHRLFHDVSPSALS